MEWSLAVLGFCGVVIAAILKAPWRRNGNSTGNRKSDCVSNEGCGERMESLKENTELKIDKVQLQLDNVSNDLGEIKTGMTGMQGTLTEVLKAVKVN